MALSSCPKCGNHTFEMAEAEPKNWRFKIMFANANLVGTLSDLWTTLI